MSCYQGKDPNTFTALAELGGVDGLGNKVRKRLAVALMLPHMHRLDCLNIPSHE